MQHNLVNTIKKGAMKVMPPNKKCTIPQED